MREIVPPFTSNSPLICKQQMQAAKAESFKGRKLLIQEVHNFLVVFFLSFGMEQLGFGIWFTQTEGLVFS